MSCLHTRGAGRRHSLLRGGFLAVGTAVSLLVAGGPAHADVVEAKVVKLHTPVIEIKSDGKVYTEPTIPLMQIAASVNVYLDALVSGRIKGFKTWLQFRTENSDWAKFPQDAYSTSFPYEQRPKTYDKDVYVSVPYGSYASYLVSYCNFQANALRHDGMTDEQIFSQDRPIEVAVHAGLKADMSGIDSSGSDGGTGSAWTNFRKMTLVCKARDPQRVPAPPPVSNDPTRDKPEVLEADLAIVEQHSLRGACSVHLSGVIRTSEPNTQVKFRYRSGDGKQSDLKTVTTDQTATAMFSHEYPLSSGGVKSGKVRIVGTSSSFASHWQEYQVDCGSSAQGYAAGGQAGADTQQSRPGGAAIGRLTKQQAQTFAIQAPKGLVRQGEIRLSGGASNGKYTLTFLRKNGGGYVAVNAAQLPKQMTGLAASFPLKALTGGRDWRLEVCPDGGAATACKTADFRLTRIGAAAGDSGAAKAPPPAQEQPEGTRIILIPGAVN